MHVHVHVCWSMVTEVYICVQDHDSRVAETAVVGFPHDVFGEGTVQYIYVYMHIYMFIYMYMYMFLNEG